MIRSHVICVRIIDFYVNIWISIFYFYIYDNYIVRIQNLISIVQYMLRFRIGAGYPFLGIYAHPP